MKFLQVLVLIFGLSIFAGAQKAILSGTVYDANGSVVPKVKIAAINEKGEKFEGVTNDEGVYILNLPFNLYDSKTTTNFRIAKYLLVIDKANGFDKFLLKDFKFVPAYSGKMIFDLALDTDNSNCGVAGCIPDSMPVEVHKTELDKTILQRPLENLPKEQNKTKRKTNNKQ